MNKKTKFIIVILLMVLCIWHIYPPKQKLKPGIDLAGGASLLYQINTEGMPETQKQTVATDMIRILQRRIDPGSKRNLIWRPHGTDYIEIQMPLADQETRAKRTAYRDALEELESYNLTRPAVQAVLNLTGEAREAGLKRIAGENNQDRLAKLEQLAADNDAVNAAREQLEKTGTELEAAVAVLKEKELDARIRSLDFLARDWATLDEPNQVARIESLAGKDDPEKQAAARKYVEIRRELSSIRNDIAGDEGLVNTLEKSWSDLLTVNIDMARLKKYLAIGGNTRTEELNAIKEANPDNIDTLIDKVVVAYDAYAKVSGRLDDTEDLKRLLRGSGVLEFRILPSGSETDLEGSVNKYTEDLERKGPIGASTANYVWKKIREPQDFNAAGIRGTFADEQYILCSNKPEETLLHEPGEKVWKLTEAKPWQDQYGSPAVSFSFNALGADRFYRLTKDNLQRPLCIMLDDEAITGPNIQSAISSSGIITGRFSQQQVLDMVDKLNAGSLPARLGDQPISENIIGPTLGRDNLHAGMVAGIIGLVLVVLFMLVYYSFAGALADLALLMNMVIIIGVMGFSGATFTMPGIAALILTIGMAVDANVLIFERIREERERGCSLWVAIQNGYSRAFWTIFDANVTTFIVALILYAAASEEVKGFALALMIGIVSSMFTALFVTRMIFDFMHEKNLLRDKLSMMQFIKNANFDWLGKRTVFWGISIVLCGLCLIAFVKGNANQINPLYSIEFTGGTEVHVQLTQAGADSLKNDSAIAGTTIREKIESRIKAIAGENAQLAASRVQSVGKPEELRFSIVTTETNRQEVTVHLPQDKAMTADAFLAAVKTEAGKLKDRRLLQSTVTPGSQAGTLIMVTDQTNRNRIERLMGAIVPDAVLGWETREIVGDAVKEALAGKLNIIDSLEPQNVTAQPINEELLQNKPYLAPFKNGVLVSATLGEGKTETLERIDGRLEKTRTDSTFDQFKYFGDYALFSNGQGKDTLTTPVNTVELAMTNKSILYTAAEESQWNEYQGDVQARFVAALSQKASFDRMTQIDPSVGMKAMLAAARAIVFSLLAIIVYVWVRFGNIRFGIAAVVALIHDVIVSVGMVSASRWLAGHGGEALLISDFKIDLPMIAGFLTIIGYSLNDTIVIFDRIRENRGKQIVLSKKIINNSINQTLSRTILTSLTTLIVVLVMYVAGGDGLRGFNYVLLIGIISGTYSTVAIASPLLYGAKDEPAAETEPA